MEVGNMRIGEIENELGSMQYEKVNREVGNMRTGEIEGELGNRQYGNR